MDKRNLTQLIATILTNANFKGFIEKGIYKGDTKRLCVPGLNCYSCPGSLGSCPIGSLQAVVGSIKYSFSYYVVGIMTLFGVIFGRFICGWLCPFGFFQDLLYKIKIKKIKVNKKLDNKLKYLKYLILLLFVIILPMFLTNEFGISKPYFCEFICPAGTLEGGIPLVLLNESLRITIGFLYAWKLFILIFIVVLSIFVYRPFCRYLCPLGAFYSVFNKFSFYKYKVDEEKCTGCKACSRKCHMNIEIYKNPNNIDCIRCGECVKACPSNAIDKGFIIRDKATNK